MAPLAYLFSLEQFGIKFGLANIRALLASLGNPQEAFRSIHIAGTNGKGSVTAMVDAVLRRAGYQSSRYTSPHMVDLSERFVVNGTPVDARELERAAGDVQRAIETALADGTLPARPTFFEATTAMAFDMFRRARVDLAVVEVGMGGRLDSTNVINPIVTAITSIDLDHQHYLGNTLAEIAGEKAGIIKPGVPVIVGDVVPEAFAAIEAVARKAGAELIRARDGVTATGARPLALRTASRDYGTFTLGLRGAHQVGNAIVAVRLLETLERLGLAVSAEAIVDGLATVTWPGRLDHRTLPNGREIVLDAAHNPAGAAALTSYLHSLEGAKPTLVFGAMRDKDVNGMLGVLLPAVGRMIVTRPSNPRAADPDELAARIRTFAPALDVDVVASPGAAIAAAMKMSPLVVVAGSIFLLGDILQEIGA